MKTTLIQIAIIITLIINTFAKSDDADTRRRPSAESRRHMLEMQRAIQRHKEAKRRRLTSCTSLETASPTQVHTTHRTVSRSKRSANQLKGKSFGLNDHHKSVYFNGNGVVLKWKKLNVEGNDDDLFIPTWSFSVDVWVKPDGGQDTPVNIVGLYDSCARRPGLQSYFWTLGITTRETDFNDREAAYSFDIRSHKTYRPAQVIDSRQYVPNVWVHLAATYDGHVTKFYVNGAKVGKTERTWGEIFTQDRVSCLQLLVGGDRKSNKYFRGEIGYINFVGEALTHHEVVKSMMKSRKHEQNVILKEKFDNLNQWKSLLDVGPQHIPSTFLSDWLEHDIGLSIPHCGQTVCDDPEVTVAYENNLKLRSHKVIRSRIINLAYDDGSHPLVEKEQIKLQAEVLRKSFKSYNISFKLEEIIVKDSVLRKKKILFGCEAEKIGDGFCDMECQHQLTGNDGGDCDADYIQCDKDKIGNGRCDLECNRMESTWDGGDCCLVNAAVELTCYDPESPNRVYMSLNEYKMALGFDNKKYLNIYFADWTTEGLVGLATFPWEHEVHSQIGGVVLKPQQFGLEGATKNLVHEIGHILGLWHTHHGITEMDCTNNCLEIQPSLELGDLCSDTNPTNENRDCHDPEVEHFLCAVEKMKRTPYRNFMGYGDDECTNHFSPQQTARMHCYLDLTHKSWLQKELPAPIPLAPRVLTTTDLSLTLSWVSPLKHGANDQDICTICQEDGSLFQYATQAWSPASSNITGYFSAMQATGRPDARLCQSDTNAWLAGSDPTLFECDSTCYLDVFFQEPVVAKRIYIWVHWNTQDGINDVILFDKAGKSVHLGKVHAFCDMHYTMEVFEDIQVRRIRLHTNSLYVSIDAVAIQSAVDHPKCQSCGHVTYKIKRDPPFPDTDSVIVEDKVFEDMNVVKNTTYKYTVTSILKGVEALSSPSLTYLHGGPYCGDGKLGDKESCDDGNLKDGDGCSLNCKIEKFFHCTGVPSLCYKHDGDGVCEEFEERASVKDCGFFTPHNYEDQWSSQVHTDLWAESYICPVEVINGPPPIVQECRVDIDPLASWHPCGTFYNAENYWVKAYFDKIVVAAGVILYLGSDGMDKLNMKPNKITVSLIDEHDQDHEGGSTDVVIACRNNPIHVNLKHDLSMAFFYTKGVLIKFQNPRIAIAAVRLRSYRYLDPRGLQTCEKGEHVYNPKTGSCTLHPCDIPLCEPYKIKHGSVACTGVSEGDVCKITCNKGYKVDSKSNEVMCLDGSWMSDIACKPVPCETPKVPYAKVGCTHGYVFGSKCKFECRHPAVKRGIDNIIECQWDGSWSLAGAYCDMICLKPSLKGGKILTPECNSSQLIVGTRCKVKCTKGYTLVEPDAQRSFSRLTCTDAGKWVGATCERVQCPAPNVIYQGLYSCSDRLFYGSQCTLKCPGPEQMTSSITCKHTGEWDATFSACEFPNGNCEQLSLPEQYTLNCDGTKIGSRCNVLCNSPDKEAVASVMNIMPSKTSLISVDSITCTGKLVWYPDPLEVHCIRKCDSEFIGDGTCDGTNNVPRCGYDGGDCCESTAKKKVDKYPDDCTDECICRDPQAEENLDKQRGENMILKHRKPNSRRKDVSGYLWG